MVLLIHILKLMKELRNESDVNSGQMDKEEQQFCPMSRD